MKVLSVVFLCIADAAIGNDCAILRISILKHTLI